METAMEQSMRNAMKYYQLNESVLHKILDIIEKQQSAPQGGTVLIGDSLIEMVPKEYLNDHYINNGIGGMCSAMLCNLINELVNKFIPKRVILHIGTNDLCDVVMESPRDIMLNVRDIVDMILSNNDCKISIVSCLFCDESKKASWVLKSGIRSNELIATLNRELKDLTRLRGIDFIDVQGFLESYPNFESLFVEDGLHLNEKGYEEIINYIKINHADMI